VGRASCCKGSSIYGWRFVRAPDKSPAQCESCRDGMLKLNIAKAPCQGRTSIRPTSGVEIALAGWSRRRTPACRFAPSSPPEPLWRSPLQRCRLHSGDEELSITMVTAKQTLLPSCSTLATSQPSKCLRLRRNVEYMKHQYAEPAKLSRFPGNGQSE